MNIDYNAVIEILKSFLNNEKIEILGISVGEERQVKDAIRNLLTAYEKEKETNKQIKCKLDEKNIPIETLLAEFERLEDLEDDLTTVYLNGVYDGEKKVQDKIKAKILECRKILYSFEKELELKANKEKYIHKESMNCLLSQISILQSLLEKE